MSAIMVWDIVILVNVNIGFCRGRQTYIANLMTGLRRIDDADTRGRSPETQEVCYWQCGGRDRVAVAHRHKIGHLVPYLEIQ